MVARVPWGGRAESKLSRAGLAKRRAGSRAERDEPADRLLPRTEQEPERPGFQDVLENFPQTRFAPMAIFSLIDAYDRLGYVEEAQAQRDRLLQQFPDSAEARQLQEN